MPLTTYYKAPPRVKLIPRKTLLIIKLATCCLLFACLRAGAQVNAQKVTLTENNTSLEKVLKKIEQQTGYTFLYENRILDRASPITLKVKQASLDQVLQLCFKKQPLTYKIFEHTVVIKENLISFAIQRETAFARAENIVKGKVANAKGEPLAGVSVAVKGTNTGTSTDANGTYAIDVVRNGTLVFSYVGFATREISVNGLPAIDVVLDESISALDQVVVVGYGTQQRKDVTGSISSITEKDFADMPMSSVSQALLGQVPGLDVVSSGNNPGDGDQIRLRGQRSFVASNDPLIILDGTPFNGSINDINPYDIKSIDVLKDASSTAIYGSLGANGVILITTRRGEIGPPKIMLESFAGIKSIYGNLPVMNGAQYADRGRESFRAAGSYNDPGINDALDKLLFLPVPYSNLKAGNSVDYQDMLLKNGFHQKYQLSVLGGSKGIKYNIAGNAYSEDGLIPSMKFQRYSLRTNLDLAVTSKVNIGASTLLTYDIQSSHQSSALNEALRNSPLGSPYAADGTARFDPADDGFRVNPLSEYIYDSYRSDNKRWLASINVFGEVKLFPELTYRINLSDQIYLNTIKESAGSFSILRRGQTNYAQIGNDVNNKKIYESILTYDKNFNSKHRLTFTAVHSIQSGRRESSGSAVSDLPYVPARYNNLTTASVINGVNSDLIETNLLSYVGRINYGYKSKYLFTASVRADGASLFAANNKWGYFPSAAIAWRVSEEKFMNSMGWLSNLKLRLSYGVSGNQAIPPYRSQGSLIGTTYAWDESAGYGLRPFELANKNLKWESTAAYNLGLDFGFLQGRISGNMELYNTNMYDLLMLRQLIPTIGFLQGLDNVGKTNNKGFELGLHTVNIKNANFSWNTSVSYYLNREKIVELYNGTTDDIGNNWFIGKPIFVYYDFNKTGIWQTKDAGVATGFASKPGDIRLLDRDNDGKYTDADRMVVGTRQPKYVLDVANTFRYKNLDLAFKVYTRWGNTTAVSAFVMQPVNRENQFAVDYWTPDNPTDAFPRPDSRALSYTYGSTLRYRDGSYIRLRQLSVGYTFPKSLLSRIKVSNARFYLTGENLWYWTKSEMRDFNIEPENSGDASSYPASRTVIAGLNISF